MLVGPTRGLSACCLVAANLPRSLPSRPKPAPPEGMCWRRERSERVFSAHHVKIGGREPLDTSQLRKPSRPSFGVAGFLRL